METCFKIDIQQKLLYFDPADCEKEQIHGCFGNVQLELHEFTPCTFYFIVTRNILAFCDE